MWFDNTSLKSNAAHVQISGSAYSRTAGVVDKTINMMSCIPQWMLDGQDSP